MVFLKCVYNITVTGTNTTAPPAQAPLLSAGYHAPRAYPITSTIQSMQMTINNDTFTVAPVSQFWPSLLWYHNPHETRFGQESLTPSMLDQTQAYEDAVNSVRNPLGSYLSNSYENARGGFSGYEVLTNPVGGTQATIRLTCVEPLVLSPFTFGKESNYAKCFIGCQNMAFTATLGNLSRVLSLVQNQGAPGLINITNTQVNLSEATLLFNYLTPDPTAVIPNKVSYEYSNLVCYPTRTTELIAPGAPVSIQMQSVQLSSIPRRIYAFARLDDSLQTAFTADSFLALDSKANPLSMTFNNNQFLSQSSSYDLYNIARKNGYQGSFSQWDRFCGSVVCLDFGTDVGLSSEEAPGVIGNYQLALKMNFINRSNVAIAPTLYVVVVYEGTVNIQNGTVSHEVGVLSRADVLGAKIDPMISYKKVEHVYGGGWWSSLKDALGKAHNFVKDNKLVSRISRLIPGGEKVSAVADVFGYGVTGGAKKKKKGGVLVESGRQMGGRMMDRKELKKMMKKGGEMIEISEEEYSD